MIVRQGRCEPSWQCPGPAPASSARQRRDPNERPAPCLADVDYQWAVRSLGRL